MGRAIQEIIVWEGSPLPLSHNLTLASGQPSLILVSFFRVDKGKLAFPRRVRVMNITAWFTNTLKDAATATTKRVWRLMPDCEGFCRHSRLERSPLVTTIVISCLALFIAHTHKNIFCCKLLNFPPFFNLYKRHFMHLEFTLVLPLISISAFFVLILVQCVLNFKRNKPQEWHNVHPQCERLKVCKDAWNWQKFHNI